MLALLRRCSWIWELDKIFSTFQDKFSHVFVDGLGLVGGV